MSGINVCATLGGNTGVPACDVRMGRIRYLLLSTSKVFTATDIASSEALQSALQTAMLLANGDANKVFAFPFMRDVTDNTGDPATGTLADGYEEVLNEALPKYLLKSTPGVCIQQIMSSFNGWPGKMYIIDENGIFWYKVNGTGTKGFTCGYLYTNPPKFKGSGDVQTANTRLTFGSISEFKSGVGALKLNFDVADLNNLKDVILDDRETENTSGSLNNVFIVGGKVKCEGTDIYTAFSTLLNNVNAWRSYKADGTALALTALALSPSNSGWQVTMDPTVYTALVPGDVFYIDLKTPAQLAVLGITGIEATKLRFVSFN